jgi:hypothetical protein
VPDVKVMDREHVRNLLAMVSKKDVMDVFDLLREDHPLSFLGSGIEVLPPARYVPTSGLFI